MVERGFFTARGTDESKMPRHSEARPKKFRQGEKSRERPLTQKGRAHGNVRPSMALRAAAFRAVFKGDFAGIFGLPACAEIIGEIYAASMHWNAGHSRGANNGTPAYRIYAGHRATLLEGIEHIKAKHQ